MKLALGTVQFGLSYGISNVAGQTPYDEVVRILEVAEAGGVRLLDTAAAYGESEAVLGKSVASSQRFQIITKLPGLGPERTEAEQLAAAGTCFERSLARLGCSSVYGLLLHRADDLLQKGGEALYRFLSRLKEAGRVEKFGVSVYSPEQLERLLTRFPVDLVQVPLNVFDQRHLSQFDHLKRLGVEIHVRSAFLQGLLLMTPEEVPPSLSSAVPHLRRYREAIGAWGLTPLQAALAFVRQIESVDQIVVGVACAQQLREILGAYHSPPMPGRDFGGLAVQELKILDPREWK